MNSKLIRTIMLALAIGFLIVWFLEFRRGGLAESYWLLLLSIICVLFFQFSRLKEAAAGHNNTAPKSTKPKPGPTRRK